MVYETNPKRSNDKMISKHENINIPFTKQEHANRNFSIPLELRKLKQWGTAKATWNQDKGKYEKFPFQVSGVPAKSNDPRTWTYFHNVRNAEYLAFFFNCDYTGLDFDHVVDNGEVQDWVLRDFIKPIESYTEISVSGTGIHIIVRGQKPKGLGSKLQLKDGHAIEIYDSGRFFLLTGNVYMDYREIKPLDQEAFFHDYVKPESNFTKYEINSHNVNDSQIIDFVNEILPAWDKGIAQHRGNELRLAIAGTLYHYGWPESKADQVMKLIIAKSEVKGISDKNAVHYTYMNGNAGKSVYGFSTLKQLITEIEEVNK